MVSEGEICGLGPVRWQSQAGYQGIRIYANVMAIRILIGLDLRIRLDSLFPVRRKQTLALC